MCSFWGSGKRAVVMQGMSSLGGTPGLRTKPNGPVHLRPLVVPLAKRSYEAKPSIYGAGTYTWPAAGGRMTIAR